MGKVLYIDEEILEKDDLACSISNKYISWENTRQQRVQEWQEIQRYIFSTDTTTTSNSKLPWSNKTTIPKLCQIRENLHANYMAAMFPKRKWLIWEACGENDESSEKKEAIETYMHWVSDRNSYYDTVSRLVYDYIDYGNCFATVKWVDESVVGPERDMVGYVGPVIHRYSPLDIVFDPTATAFHLTPKIVRSFVNMGELKDIILGGANTPEEKESAQAIYDYIKNIRVEADEYGATNRNIDVKDAIFRVNGFNSYRDYLDCDTVEVLTFYGDLYDETTDTLLKNYVIKVVDRHKIIYKAPNDSVFGYPPIFHAGWRTVQDSLWSRGPLDNLVGMQYRIDHLENMKADCFDLIAYPPVKIKGDVEPFEWGPMERIYVKDDGDVELMSPNVQVLAADNQIAILEAKMEEMAGAPKEALGFRTPGEKTKYEVQSLENAASRIFQSKIAFFERNVTEPTQNAMLELSRRNMSPTTIRILDDELNIALFRQLTRYDITGLGKIKPIAARHFAEKANMVQNITAFANSALGQDPSISQHFSSIKLAKLMENLLELEQFDIVQPFIRLSEQADSQRIVQAHQEQLAVEQQTASGMNGDYDLDQQAQYGMDS